MTILSLKNSLKSKINPAVWEFFRSSFFIARDFLLEAYFTFTPKESCRKYLGYDLYYSTGSKMIVSINDEGIYEKLNCTLIENELKKREKSCFVDVGANVGLISLYVARNVPNAHIYAFEPGESQSAFLNKNVEINGLSPRIEISNNAISDKNGVAEFFCHTPRNSAADGLVDTGKGNTRIRKSRPYLVDTVTLDSWWEKTGRPEVGVIKLDTEGSELFCLKGGLEMIRSNAPVIFLEIGEFSKKYAVYFNEIIDFLGSINYELFSDKEDRVDKNNYNRFSEKGDNFCYCFFARPRHFANTFKQ